PPAPSQRASTARYSAGSGTNCSSAPASRCSSTPLRRRSAPVRCTPAGTLTRPPPAAAASSRARCHCVVATAGSTRSCGGEVTVTAEPFGAGGPTGGEGRQGGDGAVCGAGCGTVPCGGSGVELLVRLGVLGDDVVQALAAGALDRGLVVAHRGLAHHELVVDVVQALLDGGPLGVEGLRVQRLHRVGDRVLGVLLHHLVGEVHVLVAGLVGERVLGQARAGVGLDLLLPQRLVDDVHRTVAV